MTVRPDLLALTDDSLVALANRGILKRAVKENAATPPQLTESPDGTVTAVFLDDIRTALPPATPIDAATCSCSATTLCRHLIMTVLAYRAHTIAHTESPIPATDPHSIIDTTPTTTLPPATVDIPRTRGYDSDAADSQVGAACETAALYTPGGAGTSAPADVPGRTVWSPGEFGDDELRKVVGVRAFGVAVRARRSGYRARVRRATAADPVPSVELASVTVRFLVPGDLGYARADAASGARADAIVLAVWAFQVADARSPEVESVEVTVGEMADGAAAVAAAGSVLGPLADLLADGVAHAGSQLPAIFAAAQRDLDRAGARWSFDALADLLDQLDAYSERSARHDPRRTAALVAELVARQRAGRRDWVPVLGTEESASTPLRHLRMTGLGALVHGDAESRRVEVYLAHAEARTVLTLARTITARDGAELPDAAALGARRSGPARLADYAAGNVVTETAVRSANRIVRLSSNRVARSTVMPSAGSWDNLPPELLLGDFAAESARLATSAPTLIQPRVRGASVRALIIDRVDEPRYDPGEQRLRTWLHGPTGSALATCTHATATAGAIDALIQAFSGVFGPVRFVAGPLHRHAGHLTITPTAVVAGERVIVPAFADPTSPQTPNTAPPHADPPPIPPTAVAAGRRGITAAIAEATLSSAPNCAPLHADPPPSALTAALSCTAELLHRGTRHLPPTWPSRTAEVAGALRRAGFHTAATAVDALRDLTPDTPPHHALTRWADTHIRLLVTTEQL
ncbi:hypothetical protein ACFVMC_21805 [Nocardia sp. NPDC127579]|uniref:hypothetical protein n=1 Tax=Nocardia sp. NPDC127579 TaxID=3345402 RepID=UPI00362A6605